MEKSEEMLVLMGLVLECMACTTFSFSFRLHFCLYWSVGDMSNYSESKTFTVLFPAWV